MSEYLRHTTGPMDRWDLLAATYYGDANRFEPIVRANPALGVPLILPPGVQVLIPILEEDPLSTLGLPPWRLT